MKKKKTIKIDPNKEYQRKLNRERLYIIDKLRDQALDEGLAHGSFTIKHAMLDEAANILEEKWGLENAWSRGLYS